MEIRQLQKEGEQLAKLNKDQLFKNLYIAFCRVLTLVQTHYQRPL